MVHDVPFQDDRNVFASVVSVSLLRLIHTAEPQQPYTKGQGKFGKGNGKTKKAAAMVPTELQGRDNVSLDAHGRRLCFEFNLGRCSRVPNGGECERGFHLCMRRGCHAPHPESEHPKETGSGKPT